jgi:hypothetical protein
MQTYHYFAILFPLLQKVLGLICLFLIASTLKNYSSATQISGSKPHPYSFVKKSKALVAVHCPVECKILSTSGDLLPIIENEYSCHIPSDG